MSWVRKIAVVGSNIGVDPQVVKDFVDRMDKDSNTLITSTSEGVDRVGKEAAEARGVRTVVIRPNWKKYGEGAANKADKEIVEAAHDVVVFSNFGQDERWERLVKYAIEWQRPLAVFSAAGTLLRSINQYDE